MVMEIKTCLECQKEIQSEVGFTRTRQRKTHHPQERTRVTDISSENRPNN